MTGLEKNVILHGRFRSTADQPKYGGDARGPKPLVSNLWRRLGQHRCTGSMPGPGLQPWLRLQQVGLFTFCE